MAMSEKNAARWVRLVRHGKAFFIARETLRFFVAFMIAYVVMEWLFEGHIPEFSPGRLIARLLLSMGIAFLMWWIGNGQYQSYLLDQKIKKVELE